jgi:hypothetical protein
MTTPRLLPPTALLVSAALIGAGCGGSSQPSASDAQTSYSSIKTQISGFGESIGTAMTSASRETDVEFADAFVQLNVKGHVLVARLNALKVPNALKAQRQAFSDELARSTTDLADIASAARASDAAAARAAVKQLIADSQQLGNARAAFERALNDAAK